MSTRDLEGYFAEVAALLDRSLAGGEIYTCRFDAETSDFVRLNRGQVRQPGTVTQCYLRLRLIDGRRHAEQCLTVSGELSEDRAAIAAALERLRRTVAAIPEDPHLNFATEARSSRVVSGSALPAAEQIVDTVLAAGDGLDLVGIYAGGPVYRGFANSLGQRNWHEVGSFNLQWSLYHRADKAVKTVYGGFTWAAEVLRAKMTEARERLALLARPSRSLKPGRYRAYLTPTAMEEIAGMLCWGGFSGRALETRQSCLFRLKNGAAALDRVGGLRREHRSTALRRASRTTGSRGPTRCRWSTPGRWSARWSTRAPRANSTWRTTAPTPASPRSRSTWRPASWPPPTRWPAWIADSTSAICGT